VAEALDERAGAALYEELARRSALRRRRRSALAGAVLDEDAVAEVGLEEPAEVSVD
jgi:hypothetical protein